MRRNMSEDLGLYKYLWPGSVCTNKIKQYKIKLFKNTIIGN